MHSPEQMRKKHEAMREAKHHEEHSTVTGVSEHRYLKSRQDFLQAREENPNTAVPKEMLDREYDRSPGGGYTHKRKGTYED